MVLAVVAVGLLTGVAAGQSLEEIQERLETVAAERAAIEQRIATAAADYDRLETTIGMLEDERVELERERAQLRDELEEIDRLVRFRVRESFKHGATLDPIAVFLGSDDPSTAFSKAATVQRVVAADQASSEELSATRARAEAADARLAEQEAELVEARAGVEQVTAELQSAYERAESLEASLTEQEREERARLERIRREREERERQERERQERERAAQQAAARSSARSAGGGGGSSGSSAPVRTGGLACPLDQPRSFVDSWGAPRSGGRAHRGTDIMGPLGIPVRAITSGTWSIQRPGRSAGLWAILRGDDGNHYWYLHLNSHTVGNGARVSAGQQVGTNGSTGNATAGAEHIHFELHPGGGTAINPYRTLRAACG
jgi:peptidoglycan LD-endopeptidase LytH